jgi:dolichol kinase
LRTHLADQTPAHARAANSLLLTSFTDILASLIGEQLTASILRSAWGTLASVTSSKELDNE